MMVLIRSCKRASALATLLGMALLVNPSAARADLEISYSTNSGATWTTANFASGSVVNGFAISAGNITVDISASSNSPGTPTLAKLLSSSLDVVAGASGGSIWIAIGDTGFMNPITPPDVVLSSHTGGSVIVPDSANSLSYQSYLDTGNGQSSPVVNAAVGTIFSTGAQTVNVTGGSFQSDATTLMTSLSVNYSLTELYKITLGANGEINFASNTRLTPTPEPTTMVSAIVGAGLFGGLGYLRRRNRRA